jgi:hypothetical protein
MASEEGLMTILSDFLEEQAKLIGEQAKRLREFTSTGVIPVKVEEAKPAKKKRAQKDPNQPKPPPSGYILYSQSVMNDVREEYKNEPQKNIMTIIANKWKECDAPEKEHFLQLAQQKKAEYEEKMKEYKESLPHAETTAPSSSSSAAATKSKPAAKKETASKTATTAASKTTTPAATSSGSVPEPVAVAPVESEKKKHKKHKHDEEDHADESEKKKKV